MENITDYTGERWRTVVGYSDYLISDKGNIKTLKSGLAQLMHPCLNKGYFQTTLTTSDEFPVPHPL